MRIRPGSGAVRTLVGAVPAVVLILLAIGLWLLRAAPADTPAVGSGATPELAADQRAAADIASVVLNGRPGAVHLPRDLAMLDGTAYVALRTGGTRLSEAWAEAGTAGAALTSALRAARERLNADELRSVDAVEIDIASDFEEISLADPGDRFDNVHRGILGVEVDFGGDRPLRVAPSEMIAENTGFRRALERVAEENGMEPSRFATGPARVFGASQLLVTLEPAALTRLFRGNEVVPAEAVTHASTVELESSLGDWLARQVGTDGRLLYAYWPSRGEESEANNMIRQWMGTIALGRVARERDAPELARLVEANIRYNLANHYAEDDGNGLVADPDGDVKLGAVALAALAIAENDASGEFASEEQALRRTVDGLWRSDGSFLTFYRPAGRNDNQNFYPGEALLLWAETYRRTGDAQLRDRFERSFHHYRDWHLANRNPAFVPWHTMADVAMWEETGDPELRDFVFEMNDWLLAMQQHADDVPYPDLAGRFYDPERPDYGPPHASSDGVYLEGLAAAHRLAVAVGDDARAAAYRGALMAGLRHLMQLQFADEVDLYYVSRPDPVLGGVRTTGYDNEIRIDNVQHNLMAVQEILRTVERDDFSPTGSAPPD